MGAAVPTAEGEDDRKGLERLVVDNDELERLETLVAEFNIFEAIGAVRNELRHSELLAFLLDPSEPHGLGDTFLRRLLQRALAGVAAGKAPVSPVRLDVLDLDEVEVRREWSSLDILLLDGRNKLAVIIENKIDSREHSDQLRRYWSAVEQEFPGYGILGLYLTPDRDERSDDRYVAIDYGLVADIVKRFLEARASIIGPDVKTMLRHYEQMLRRYIVTDSEIADLCRSLYRKHRRALDLIFAHRPDPGQGAVRDVIDKLVHEAPDLVLDDCSRAYVRFAPTRWDVPKLKAGTGWTKTGRILLFEFVLTPEKATLKLLIGPGPAETRERLFRAAQTNPTVFKAAGKSIAAKWNQIYTRGFFDSKTAEAEAPEAIEEAIRDQWGTFTTKDLPLIISAFDAETWLWS